MLTMEVGNEYSCRCSLKAFNTSVRRIVVTAFSKWFVPFLLLGVFVLLAKHPAVAQYSSGFEATVVDPTGAATFDRLAKFGAIASNSEVSSFKKYIGGNLNPANWIRPLSKIGHDILFKPGALDQRARLYIADLIKSQHPEFRDSQIAQAVNEQLGNYNRANWTRMQTQLSKFMLFPGWDMSSLNWVLRHPIKTSVPPALLIWAANQTINAMGGNRESEKNDFFAIHAGNRALNTGLIREPLGTAVGGAALRFGHALVEGKSSMRAIGEASLYQKLSTGSICSRSIPGSFWISSAVSTACLARRP